MFILDTNVLSAMMGSRPAPEVAHWMAGQAEDNLFTSTISQAEILAGITALPEGRRRSGLERAAATMFRDDFAGRILAFDSGAAEAYAGLFAARKRAARPAAPLDLMIAAIAHANGAAVVTHDAGGFDGCDITVINPWEDDVRR
jgi:predicted nucleic acid-binding protein